MATLTLPKILDIPSKQAVLTKLEKDRAYGRQHYAQNKERYKRRHYAWAKANPAKVRAYQRKYYSQNPEKDREWHLKKTYGISLARFCEMLAAQEYRCGICQKQFPTPKSTHVDHCHDTNKIRGLLCYKCNSALGLFFDDKKFLQSAIRYLEKWEL